MIIIIINVIFGLVIFLRKLEEGDCLCGDGDVGKLRYDLVSGVGLDGRFSWVFGGYLGKL